MLSNSPGGVNFEAAPFKLTRELLEVMGSNSEGQASEMFDYYKARRATALLPIRCWLWAHVEPFAGVRTCSLQKHAIAAACNPLLYLNRIELCVISLRSHPRWRGSGMSGN